MNQELMTLDFWQDTVIYEGKTFPVGTLACDALNVPADTITKMNEQCEKINLLLGMLNDIYEQEIIIGHPYSEEQARSLPRPAIVPCRFHNEANQVGALLGYRKSC